MNGDRAKSGAQREHSSKRKYGLVDWYTLPRPIEYPALLSKKRKQVEKKDDEKKVSAVQQELRVRGTVIWSLYWGRDYAWGNE
jgi:hypothetical protein